MRKPFAIMLLAFVVIGTSGLNAQQTARPQKKSNVKKTPSQPLPVEEKTFDAPPPPPPPPPPAAKRQRSDAPPPPPHPVKQNEGLQETPPPPPPPPPAKRQRSDAPPPPPPPPPAKPAKAKQ